MKQIISSPAAPAALGPYSQAVPRAGDFVFCSGHYDFGDLARLHVLDARQYRTPPICAPKASDSAVDCVTRDDPSRTMLGDTQEQWLAQGLGSGSGGAWNVICQQTRFTTGSYARGENHPSSSDRWDGYPDARKRVIGMIEASAPRRTLIMGGDNSPMKSATNRSTGR